jgi:putative tricarboxylic transport membrane protein
MVSADRIAGSLFFLLGLGVIVGAVRLDVGTPSEPQAGFFPFLGGVALVALSAILVIQDLRGRGDQTESFGNIRPPLLALAGLIAFVAAAGPLGYVPAMAILTVILLFVFEVRQVWAFVVAGVVVPLGTYILFDRILGVPLPPGPIDGWLGL